MKKLIYSCLFLIATASIECGAQSSDWTCSIDRADRNSETENLKTLRHVSIFSLVTKPQSYNGERIIVGGIFHLYMDRIAIFASREHYEANDYSSLVWADLPKCLTSLELEDMSRLNGRFVSVSGYFDSNQREFAVGTIVDVERVAGPTKQ